MMKVNDWMVMQKKLENYARGFLMQAYGMELRIPVQVNGRLKSKNGVFWHTSTRKESLRIEISKNYIEHQEWETVLSTVRHECIHYALYELDRNYKDGQADFENELVKHKSHSTKTIAYKGKVESYGCPCCSRVWNKKRKYPRNGVGYKCPKCKEQIKYLGQKVV